MNFNPGLKPEEVINNVQLTDIFKCGPQGGMRRSLETNTLVLVSNHTKSLYDDVWKGTIFHYTGMGTKGHQSLNFMQNRTLVSSIDNGVDLFLFEVFTPKQYKYIGRVELAGEPYQTEQPDEEGNIRTVWMFPLQVLEGKPAIPVDKAILDKEQERRERNAQSLSNEELLRRALLAKGTPGYRQTYSNSYQRNPDVVILAKRRAKGTCQLCGNQAPFDDKYGAPYLECHHIIWLSEGGHDSPENTVALCPNCHRKMHHLNLPEDVALLKNKAQQVL